MTVTALVLPPSAHVDALAWLQRHRAYVGSLEVWRQSADPFPQYLPRSEVILGALGLYDQTTDAVAPGGGALLAATNFNPGEYYELVANGAFVTPLPELNGLSGNTGDRIYSDGSVWVLATAAGAYLSKTVADTAAGKISFTVGADSAVAAAAANDLTRKAEVDAADASLQGQIDGHVGEAVPSSDPHGAMTYTDQQDAAHAALQANPDDVHGTRSYTDGAVAAHAALTTAANDVHGSKTYADAGDSNLQSQLDAHTGDASIHWEDAPIGPMPHGRYTGVWQPLVNTGLCAGDAASLTLSPGFVPIVDYASGGDSGSMNGQVDILAGTIALPVMALYRVTAFVYGTQGNDTKEEMMRLWVRVAGGAQAGDSIIGTYDIATDKTNERSISCTFTRALDAGQTLQLGLDATAGLGSFSVLNTTFEVSALSALSLSQTRTVLTVGFNGVDRYGYEKNSYGTLVPDTHNGIEVVAVFSAPAAAALTAAWDLYGTSNVTVTYGGFAPGPITMMRLGPGIYQAFSGPLAELHTFLGVTRGAGTDVSISIKEAP